MTGSPRLSAVSLQTLLEMAPFGCWGLPVALLTLLCCPGSGEKAFEVSMWPEQVTVKHGESLTVNCSTSCLQPQAGGLETVLSKRLLAEAAQWKQFLVYNVSKDTALLCYFSCFGEQKSKTANVSVFCESSRSHPLPGKGLCLLNGCKAILLLLIGTSLMAAHLPGLLG